MIDGPKVAARSAVKGAPTGRQLLGAAGTCPASPFGPAGRVGIVKWPTRKWPESAERETLESGRPAGGAKRLEEQKAEARAELRAGQQNGWNNQFVVTTFVPLAAR